MAMSKLLCDYDGPVPDDLVFRIRHLAKTLHWRIGAVRIDKTRRGHHVVIDVRKRLDFAIVVAAQAVLGSDPHRELHNLKRALVQDVLPAFWRARSNTLFSQHDREGHR